LPDNHALAHITPLERKQVFCASEEEQLWLLGAYTELIKIFFDEKVRYSERSVKKQM